jgi:hypothetical protein
VADTLALELLIDGVAAELADATRYPYATAALPMAFGWREAAQQPQTLPRIVWKPGTPTEDAGQPLPPKYPGRQPYRSIGTLRDYVTVTLSAFDPGTPEAPLAENERAQWKAARLLLDDWWRAVFLVAEGTFSIESVTWIKPPKERPHGAALQVVCAIESMIPDSEATSAPVDTEASIETTELGVTEIELVEAVPD